MQKVLNCIFTLLLCALLIIFVSHFLKNKTNNENYVVLGGQKVFVTVVTTEKDREQGLSGKNKLESGEGMLFIFEKPDKYGFWMKDMKFPIDILWINKDFQIVDVEQNVNPETFPKIFYPQAPALYVLEIESSFSRKNNVKTGDEVKISVLGA